MGSYYEDEAKRIAVISDSLERVAYRLRQGAISGDSAITVLKAAIAALSN